MITRKFLPMFLRKDATKHLGIRVDELLRKTTIYAKTAIQKEKADAETAILQRY